MKPLVVLVAAATLGLSPALALEPPVNPAAEIALQSCLEAVHAAQADPETIDRPSGVECIGAGSTACQEEEGDSTLAMVGCNQTEAQFWGELWGYYYDTLRDQLAPEVSAKLQAAQEAWEPWRDAKCAFTYELWKDGTISQVLHSYCEMEVMAEWALELGDVLMGAP